MYLNKAYIIGNLTRDPELKALPSGLKVANFSVATSRSYKDKDGVKQDTTEYHNVVAFGKLGELSAQYLKKGQQVLVEGRLQTRSWETNGDKKYRTEIIADNVQFGMKPTGGGGGAANAKSSYGGDAKSAVPSDTANTAQPDAPADKIDYPSEDINPDDIPF